MADIKNYGLVGIGANVQLGKNGGYIDYTGGAFSLSAFGGVDGNLAAGNVTISNTFSDGTLTIASGSLSTTGDLTADVVNFGSLNDGSISIVSFIDDDTMASASNTTLATSESIKAYVDAQVTTASLTFTDDAASAGLVIDLDSETLTIAGGTNITTAGSGNTLTVNLDDNVTLTGNLSAVNGTFSGDVDVTGIVTGGTLTDGIANITGGNFTTTGNITAVDATFTGDVVITGNIVSGGGVGGDITGADTMSANSLIALNDLTVNSFTVDGIIDDDTMATASNTTLATSESIKAYIDGLGAGTDLSVASDSGTGAINLQTETMTITGTANEVTTAFDGVDTFTIGLPDDVTIGNNLTVSNDLLVSGNLTVNGTQTIVNTTTVNIEDNIIRVNTSGTGPSAGLEANVGGAIESMVYDPNATLNPDSNNPGAWVFSDDVIATTTLSAGNLQTSGTATVGTLTDGTLSITGGSLTTTGDLTADVVNFGSLADGAITITGFVDEDTMVSNSATLVPTQQSVKAYVDAQVTAQDLDFQGDTGGALAVDLDSQSLTIAGGTNINTAGVGQTLTVNLDPDVTLAGNLVAVDGTFSGTLEFGSLTDGSVTIDNFVTQAAGIVNNNNETTIPTTAAIIDYVSTNSAAAPDGLLLRDTFTADSVASTFDVGTMPSIAGRTYYADKIVIKVATAVAGGGFDHILVVENNGAGVTLVAEPDADAATVDTYVVVLDGSVALTAGQPVQLQFMQANGTTPAVVTGGVVTVSVHYNWV